MIGKIKNVITKLVYPDGLCCIVCDDELWDDADRADGFCPKCRPKKNSHYCLRCGVALPVSQQDYCNSCLYIGNENLYFDAARAPYPYAEESVRAVVHQFKYREKKYLKEYMVCPMLETLRNEDWEIDAITYVPIHKKKRRKRGYNQSELLAKRIATETGLPLITALEKTVYAKAAAADLGREERRALLAGTFALTGEDLKGKNILLIDDVVTSKATANECAKMLKIGKARRVYVLSFATSRGDKEETY